MGSNVIKERNYGVDLLRILSMFMVVLLHIVGVGGMKAATIDSPLKYNLICLLNIAAVCAVNCYGLISGYVGYKSSFKLSNIAAIWLQVFFYSAGFAVLFFAISPSTTSIKEVVKLFMPVLMERYWYFTAYFILLFVMPLLNIAINQIPKKLLFFILCAVSFLLTVCQSTVLLTNAFGTNSGYSFVWLLVLYLIGGYIGKYGLPIKHGWLWYLASVIVVWLAEVIFSASRDAIHSRLAAYNSPFVLLMAVGLLVSCSQLQIGEWLKKVISFLAPLSFSVYLIHLHPFVRNKILLDAFTGLTKYSALLMIPIVIILTVLIYVVCSLIDLFRHHLFKALRIKERLSNIEERYLSKYIK